MVEKCESSGRGGRSRDISLVLCRVAEFDVEIAEECKWLSWFSMPVLYLSGSLGDVREGDARDAVADGQVTGFPLFARSVHRFAGESM